MSASSMNTSSHNKEYNKSEEDRISQLPDDILIMILSHLETMDVPKTSLVSKRWRYVWTYVPNLDFDHSDMYLEWEDDPKLAFVHRIDKTMSLHRAPLMERFKVCHYELKATHSSYVNDWVKSAMSKRVNYLELDFGNGTFFTSSKNYTLTWDVFNISPFVNGFTSLKSLSLTCVNINQRSLELALSKFHGLERLFVEDSKHLEALEVNDSATKLKYLGIRNCPIMKSLKLGSKSLVSFEFVSYECRTATKVVYNSVPSLSEACFGGKHCHALLVCDFPKILTFSAQLVKLSLNIFGDLLGKPFKLSSFQNLRRLELTIRVCAKLHAYCCFLEACPSLLELELRVHSMCSPYKKEISSGQKWQVSPPINQFGLYFLQESRSYLYAIERWIICVISRRVERLMLHSNPITPYVLQSDILEDFRCHVGLSFLKSLCFRNVNVSGEVIELVLSRCRLLEELRVENSYCLVNLKVTNSSSTRLKCLAISRCSEMKSLEICASNLSCFEFSGPETVNVAYNGLPSLVEVVFSEGYVHHQLLPNFKQISCFSEQLVKLSLNLVKVCSKDVEFPAFPNVKQLELSVTPTEHDQNLLPIASFAEACPVLHKLRLEIWWKCSCLKFKTKEDVKYATREEVKLWPEITHDTSSLPSLKIFEWVEYSGIDHVADMELALYIVKNACRLEKLICHTTNPWCQFGTAEKVFRGRAVGRKINYSDFLEYQICHDRRSIMYKPVLDNWKKHRGSSRCRAERMAGILPSKVNVYII